MKGLGYVALACFVDEESAADEDGYFLSVSLWKLPRRAALL